MEMPQNCDKNVVLAEWDSLAGEQLPLKSLTFDPDECSLSVLDQRLLPSTTEYVRICSLQEGFEAIRDMKVRGAPLIASVGMLSLLVDLRRTDSANFDSPREFLRSVAQKCRFLLSARPTAINLANAFRELDEFLREKEGKESGGDALSVDGLRDRIGHFVVEWQARERAENDRLLRNAVGAVVRGTARRDGDGRGLTLVTICNTGQLATSSFGTALGVILVLHRLGLLELAIVLETRPYNQGSRLTAFELRHSGVPFRLIADSAAASAMREFGADAVLVGADQVARNGDTANKIGTYSLAILARHHGIPFFVVTPMASVNGQIGAGDQIRIEQRPAEELTTWNGTRTCPAECPVWNPAFDVTPAELISQILTEKGNFVPSELANHLE